MMDIWMFGKEIFLPGIIAVLVVGIALYLRWLKKNDDYWEKRGIPYQPRISYINGLRRFFSKPLHELLCERYKKFGRIYGSFEFRKPILTVCEPDLLRDILVKDFHVFHYRRDFKSVDSIFGKMVSFLKGEDWKRVRTIITPAFTSKRMREMSPIINESSQTVVETFGKYAERGEPADCKEIFGAFSMDVIASAAFGTKIDSHNDPDNVLVRNVKNGFFQGSFRRFLTFLILPNWIIRRYRLGSLSAMDFFKTVVSQVVGKRKELRIRYNDVLQLFMDAQDPLKNESPKQQLKPGEQEDDTDHFGCVSSDDLTATRLKYNRLSDEEFFAQCILFFFVGYETTATSLAYLAYCLALNPDCQDKLMKEVDEIFSKQKELNYDVIRDMKYLDCVVSETLRMYPVVARSERTAAEDYKLGNTGIVIEKGTTVGFNIHAMHYDSEFFSNPDKFEPERFESENITHPQYAYLPFGAGPRNCLGMRFALMEIKLCISNVLRRYRFRKAPTTKIPLEYKAGQILINPKEISLIIERRNDSECTLK